MFDSLRERSLLALFYFISMIRLFHYSETDLEDMVYHISAHHVIDKCLPVVYLTAKQRPGSLRTLYQPRTQSIGGRCLTRQHTA